MKNGTPVTPAKKNKFILFVSGMSLRSIHAVENFEKICEEYLADDFELEIVDVTKQKYKASQYQIIALPTLIRIEPAPVRTIIGDLSEKEKVLRILNIPLKN